MGGAAIASQMNPLAIPTLVESQAVEIQASLDFHGNEFP